MLRTDSARTATYERVRAGVTAPVISDGSASYTPGISDYHSGLKSAHSQTGSSQTITASRSYDAFGNVVTSSGTWKGPFGYAGGFGYQEDGDSGLKLLGHRYMDSTTGRFLTRDPVMDGHNWYNYCANRPISFVDPSGNKFEQEFYDWIHRNWSHRWADRYARDVDWQDAIHEAKGNYKIDGARSNPDMETDEDLKAIIRNGSPHAPPDGDLLNKEGGSQSSYAPIAPSVQRSMGFDGLTFDQCMQSFAYEATVRLYITAGVLIVVGIGLIVAPEITAPALIALAL